MQAPKIDKRSYEDIVKQTETLVQSLTPWQPNSELDAGGALIRIFGRYAEIIIDRLNQVPEKNFLAFLNLIGADLAPAQPARVPLTFQLATDSPVDAFVPAGTQVAAPADESSPEETIFETEQDLLVTRSNLTAVYVRNFDFTDDQDRYGNYTAVAKGVSDAAFPYFAGDTEMEHCLYLACDALLNIKEPTDCTLTMQSDSAAVWQSLPLSWAYWDEENKAWQPFSTKPSDTRVDGNRWLVPLNGCPPLKAGLVNGVEGGWLRLKLELPLPAAKQGIPLDGYASGSSQPAPITFPLTPYPTGNSQQHFYLSGDKAFLRRGAQAVLNVALAEKGKGSNLSITGHIQTGGQSDTSTWQAIPLEDGTNGLTQDGQIRFQIPVDGRWSITPYRGWTGRWLRLTLSGSYSQAPVIQSISSDYEWHLPTIESFQLNLPQERPPLFAEQGFYNSITLDLSKDFYPFDQEPQFNDVFYLGYGQLFTEGGLQAGDNANINVALTQVGNAGGGEKGHVVTLLWEFWNGRRWEPLGKSSNQEALVGNSSYAFKDETLALTVTDKKVQFSLPTAVKPNSVNGEEGYWLRVRLVSGNYGQPARYAQDGEISVSGQKVPTYTLVEATFQPPIVAALTFDVAAKNSFPLSACLSYNDFTFTHHVLNSGNFRPFTPTSDDEPTLYLGFDQPFDNRSVTLYTQVKLPAPEEVIPQQFKEKSYRNPAQLLWEFSQGVNWSSLGVSDETNAFSTRGTIRFIGPKLFAPRQLFGQHLYWIRIRWHQGQFTIFPYGQSFHLNTVWASQATTIRDEQLGSSNGNPNQQFQTLQTPVQLGQQLQVREMSLSNAELSALQKQKAVTLVSNGEDEPNDVWTHWEEVPDFYTSGARDRHYTLDHLTGQIRFGNGVNGMIPPIGQNNIRIAIYQNGGGEQGNRARETIIQLKTAVPYIDSVTNYEAAAGGTARQSLAHVKKHGPKILRHRNRAVTYEDIEDLAFAASNKVARAKAMPTPSADPASIWLPTSLQKGEVPQLNPEKVAKEAGRIGLIIVPQSNASRPAPSPELLDRVRRYVLAHMEATADLWISGPEWMAVTITAVIVPASLSAADFLSEKVVAVLEKFLHPLTGGFDGKGWQFGRRPYRSDLYAVIEGIAEVEFIKSLTVAERPTAEQLHSEQFLIFSGAHDVTIDFGK